MNINIQSLEDLTGIAEELDWATRIDYNHGLNVEFEKHTPAGEHFCFSVHAAMQGESVSSETLEAICDSVSAYSAGFNAEEHIEGLLDAKKSGLDGVPSVRELVEDADAIQQMFRELAEALVYGHLGEKHIYEVTIGRTGVVFVKAESDAAAMELADHLTPDKISWSDDWSPTDVVKADNYDGAVYTEPSF